MEALSEHVHPKARLAMILAATALSFGPQYIANVSSILDQSLLQSGLAEGLRAFALAATLSNLGFAACVPIGLRLTQRFGLRQTYLPLAALFLAACALSATAPNPPVFAISRTIEGVAAGSLFLTTLPVSLTSFPAPIRGRFIAYAIGGLYGMSALGTVVGAVALLVTSWRWVFAIAGLLSALGIVLGLLSLPHQPAAPGARWDFPGTLLLAAMAASLAPPLVQIRFAGLGATSVWPWLITGALLFLVWIAWETQSRAPLLQYRAIRTVRQISGAAMAILSHVALIFVLVAGYQWLQALDDASSRQWLTAALLFVGCLVVVAVAAMWLHPVVGPGVLGAIGSVGVLAVGWLWREQTSGVSVARVSCEMAVAVCLIGLVLIMGALTTALAGDLHEARLRSCSLHFHRNLAGALAPPFAGWWMARSAAVAYEHLRDHATLFQPSALYAYQKLVAAFELKTGSLAEAEQLAGAALLAKAERISLLAALHHTADVVLVIGCAMLAASVAMAVTGKGRPLSQPAPAVSHVPAQREVSEAKPRTFVVR
ncbi:MFS transporter [Alicyclobacillus mali (ex Roth et al. 2021)]|uniref:MFS transporter n=1 Tax=Alicyclobacillus mali (ex Roth et al. 2021) TaxID=1123961 RepID=UPI001A9013ED|nr:MFS transporter [Alicyclobacillus mali (ex Roth et al. 2021)]